MGKPLVSICCITYNHEHYIRDALDGFIMQKTNFPIEIVISDDCSKDNTREIIAEYKDKYSNLIRDVSPTENIGAIPNFNHVIAEANSKYVAICEGDDYWTDPYKLQKQVDFLEAHPDYSMCCHGADVKNETPKKVDCTCEHMATREYFPEDAFPTWQIPTASIVYRREKVEKYKIKRASDFFASDVVLILACMHVGRVWGFADHMSVYRVNAGGLTRRRTTSWDEMLKSCKHYEALMDNFPKIDKDFCYRYIAMVHYTYFRKSSNVKNKLSSLWIAIKNKPSYVLRKMLRLKTKPRSDLFYQYYHC